MKTIQEEKYFAATAEQRLKKVKKQMFLSGFSEDIWAFKKLRADLIFTQIRIEQEAHK